MWWKAWCLTIGLALGCYAGPVERATKQLITPGEADEVLRPPFGYGGIWFPDPKCRAQFSGLGRITEDQLDEFKRCIAALGLRISARQDDKLGAALLTYGPGFELEARFMRIGRSAWLRWIGYVGRRAPQDGLPTISPEAFEELRIAGDPHQPLDTGARVTLDRAVAASKEHLVYSTLKVCIGNDGSVTTHRRLASSPPVDDAFITAISQEWKFRPFTYGGQSLPVCVLLELMYPFDNDKMRQRKLSPIFSPPSPPELTTVPSATLGPRLAGEPYVILDDANRSKFQRAGLRQTTGVFAYCIDTTGAVTSVQVHESTGFPAYDAEITKEIHLWRYAPYLVAGVPTAVCSLAVYVYNQQ